MFIVLVSCNLIAFTVLGLFYLIFLWNRLGNIQIFLSRNLNLPSKIAEISRNILFLNVKIKQTKWIFYPTKKKFTKIKIIKS